MQLLHSYDSELETRYMDFKMVESAYLRLEDKLSEEAGLMRDVMLELYHWFRKRIGVQGKIIGMSGNYYRLFLRRPLESTRLGSLGRERMGLQPRIFRHHKKVG